MIRSFVVTALCCVLSAGATYTQTASNATPPPVKSDPFVLQSVDGAYQLRIGAYVQLDGRFASQPNADDTSSFLLRRARPVFTGKLAKLIQFRVMPDFGEGKTVLQDAWIQVRVAKPISILGGKGKVPFGQERLQSATDLPMIERSLANNLVPNRDIGVAAFSEWFGRRLTVDGGVFNGVPDGGSADADSDNGKEIALRIAGEPVAIKALQLRVGIAATHGVSTGPAGVNYKTPAQQTFFTYDAATAGDGSRTRLSPQATVVWRSGTLTAEYVASAQELRHGTDRDEIQNTGWQTAARWLFGGNPSINGKVTPTGARTWEIVARASALSVDEEAFPRFADPARNASGATSIGAGVNFYPLSPLKLMLDYEHTSFDAAASSTPREDENFVGMRMQITF